MDRARVLANGRSLGGGLGILFMLGARPPRGRDAAKGAAAGDALASAALLAGPMLRAVTEDRPR